MPQNTAETPMNTAITTPINSLSIFFVVDSF